MSYLSNFEETYIQLYDRLDTFKMMLEYIDKIDKPRIIETGTTRTPNNFAGDGCSTIVFNEYLNTKYENDEQTWGKQGGSRIFHNNLESPLISIDIDSNVCSIAKKLTDNWVSVITGDSINVLSKLKIPCDLLYLDSLDFVPEEFNRGINTSSEHHLKELLAAQHLLKDGTLIVVDDSLPFYGYGKGQLIKQYFDAIGIEPYFSSYQIGWIWETKK